MTNLTVLKVNPAISQITVARFHRIVAINREFASVSSRSSIESNNITEDLNGSHITLRYFRVRCYLRNPRGIPKSTRAFNNAELWFCGWLVESRSIPHPNNRDVGHPGFVVERTLMKPEQSAVCGGTEIGWGGVYLSHVPTSGTSGTRE